MSVSLDAAAAAARVMLRRETRADPRCAACGHGALDHAMIGAGTCAGRDFAPVSTPMEASCSCVRFVFATTA